MINLSYDLHIHSCLSPCGDDEMTPANIAGMAAVLGLDVIALTDHNTCRNCGPAMAAAGEYGVLLIPGMELTTMEEVHAVCLFRTLEAALDFDSYVYKHLLKVPNQEKYFGHQYLYDAEDRIIGSEPNLLINATDIEFDAVLDECRCAFGNLILVINNTAFVGVKQAIEDVVCSLNVCISTSDANQSAFLVYFAT